VRKPLQQRPFVLGHIWSFGQIHDVCRHCHIGLWLAANLTPCGDEGPG
jgi:hypothetical protein